MTPEQNQDKPSLQSGQISEACQNKSSSRKLSTNELGGLLNTLRGIVIDSRDLIIARNSEAAISRNQKQYLRESIGNIILGKVSLEEGYFEILTVYIEDEKKLATHLKSEFDRRVQNYEHAESPLRSQIEQELLLIAKLNLLDKGDFLSKRIVTAFSYRNRMPIQYELLGGILRELDDTLFVELLRQLPFVDIKGKVSANLANELVKYRKIKDLSSWLSDIHERSLNDIKALPNSKDKSKAHKTHTSFLAGVQYLNIELSSLALNCSKTDQISYKLLVDTYSDAINPQIRERAREVLVRFLHPEAAQTFLAISNKAPRKSPLKMVAFNDYIDAKGEADILELQRALNSGIAGRVQYACERLSHPFYGDSARTLISEAAITQIRHNQNPIILASLLWSGSPRAACSSSLVHTLERLTPAEVNKALFMIETSSGYNFYMPSSNNTFNNYASIVEERNFEDIILQLNPITLLKFHEKGGSLAGNAALILQRVLTNQDNVEIRRALVEQLVRTPKLLQYLKEIVGLTGFSTGKLNRS